MTPYKLLHTYIPSSCYKSNKHNVEYNNYINKLSEENFLTAITATSRDDGEAVMCELTIVSAAILGTFIREQMVRDAGIMIDR
jgi:hypothetical protein